MSTATPTHRAPRPPTTDAPSNSPKTAASASSDSAGDSTSGSTGTEPITAAIPVIPIPQVGGPTDRATTITQIFLSALTDGNVQLARTMTDTDIDEKQLKSLDTATMFTVRSSEVGPDLVSERIVISEYRTSNAKQTTTFICADWDVELATGRIHQLGSKQLGDVRDGVIVPGDLADTLGGDCATLRLT